MMIGLTGGIGSGKSTVAQMFFALNIEIIDSDQITRQLVKPNQPALQAIIQHFGETIISSDGTLNRAKLRAIIFESAIERQWLENLLHPMVKAEISKLSNKKITGAYQIVEIPLLFEANFEKEVDRILVVDCPEITQIERVHRRDRLTTTTIQAIMASQISRTARLSKADDVIVNEGSEEELKRKVLSLHHYYIELSK